MDFISALDIIINDLKEAREIIDDLKNYPHVPAFQIELARSKCKSAEEVLTLLKTIQPLPGKVMPEEIEPEKPVIQAPAPAAEDTPEKNTRPEKKSQPIFADTFGKTSSIVNEQIGTRKKDDDISSVVKSKPVINLKDAIGINDKFLYIRELFEGNPSRYEEAITRLNETADLDEARTMIFALVDNDEENEVALQLFSLVKRKISSDG